MLVGSIIVLSCDPDSPEPPNEEELITTLIYTLSPDDGGDDVEFVFRDLDGDGGVSPIVTTAPLQASTTYSGTITLSNETESPVEDITEEIREEDEEHQFFFASSLDDVTVAYGDADSDSNPIGLVTTLTTGDAGMGTLRITLKHEPEKSATGVSTGDITNAGGETDIEVTFNLDVQ